MSDEETPDAEKDAESQQSDSSASDGPERKVGYGRPPVHRQFKPGQSGNQKGRPKGRRNVKTIVSDVFRRKVTIRENGKVRRVTEFEAMYLASRAKALKADARSFSQVMSAITRFDVLDDDPTPTAADPIADEDRAIIERFLLREGGSTGDGSKGEG